MSPRRIVFLLAMAFIFAVLAWASDKVGIEGERTVYTVQCVGGSWQGNVCTGRLAAGDLHRFRASRSRGEVIYWIASSPAPSGKFTRCQVKDRGNWKCGAPPPGQPPTITREMANGRPVREAGQGADFHAVRKWEWWLVRTGIPLVKTADFQVDR